MKIFAWNEEKNRWLETERNITFDDVVRAYAKRKILEVTPHHNIQKYPHQKIIYFLRRNYVYMVPFLDEGERWFLKTIIPTRRYTKSYRKIIQKGEYG